MYSSHKLFQASQLHLQEEELEAGDEVEDSVVGKRKIISGGQTTTKEVKQPAGEDQERNGKTQALSQKDQMPPEKYQVSSEEDRSSAEENQLTSEKNQRVTGKHALPAGDQFSPEERKAPAVKGRVEEAPAVKGGIEEAPAVKGGIGEAPAMKGRVEEAPAVKGRVEEAPAVKEGKTKNKLQPVLVFNAEQLNGTRRYVVDNLISDIKCKILTTLIHVAGEQGDGYHRNINPHTEAEDFLGLTLSRAGLMVHAGLLEPELLQLVLQVTATAKRQLVQHFQLVEPLYFSYTHLVCRTAKPEYYGSRVDGDMSHVVHVDNCIMYSPSECHQRPPAYTFRDYSAIVYLNHDFQGGEFVFTTDPRGEDVQSSVQSKCGRMVGFSAGPENPHGVRAVLRGSRCAVALWFTHDEKHKDKERILAETLLNKIKSGEIKVK
ncbi:Oxoglutarate/iron-dependent dioxygenase [Trinorchestia longiramus]|nr:Oxoglutarate/iron-dependent dioxygenase [Trinorchestia longiramus]